MEKIKKLDENISLKECSNCGKPFDRDWNYCPFCKSNLRIAKLNKEHFQRGNEWLKQQLEE